MRPDPASRRTFDVILKPAERPGPDPYASDSPDFKLRSKVYSAILPGGLVLETLGAPLRP